MRSFKSARLIHRPRGITALEILVVIACIAILSALVMSGIANARNSARANDCRNRLRQLGVATHNFESAYQRLPPGSTHFFDLLPYVGNQPLYDQLAALEPRSRLTQMQQTHGALPQFVCPADAFANSNDHNASYRLNSGTVWGFDEKNFPYNGMVAGFFGQNSIPLQQVRDGQSNTVLYSERLVKIRLSHLSQADADAIAAQNQHRFWWQLPGSYSFGEEEKFATDCQQESNRKTFGRPNDSRGISVLSGKSAWYNHILSPNSAGCKSTNRITPATSQHSGGVNALFVDGSVKFVNESIDSGAWAAVGTRAGNEAQANSW